MKRKSVGVVAASMLLVATSAVTVSPQVAGAAASGTLECSNGLAIQGIWVEAQDPAKRGWASRWNINGVNWQNGWYHAPLGPNDPYQVRVGCGSWTPTFTSAMMADSSRNFICVNRYGSALCYDS